MSVEHPADSDEQLVPLGESHPDGRVLTYDRDGFDGSMDLELSSSGDLLSSMERGSLQDHGFTHDGDSLARLPSDEDASMHHAVVLSPEFNQERHRDDLHAQMPQVQALVAAELAQGGMDTAMQERLVASFATLFSRPIPLMTEEQAADPTFVSPVIRQDTGALMGRLLEVHTAAHQGNWLTPVRFAQLITAIGQLPGLAGVMQLLPELARRSTRVDRQFFMGAYTIVDPEGARREMQALHERDRREDEAAQRALERQQQGAATQVRGCCADASH